MLVDGLCRMQKRWFRCRVDLRKASHPGMFTVVRSVCLFVGWVVMQNYSSDWSCWTWHMYLCILKLVAVIPVVCTLSITWWMWHLYLSVLSISVLNCNFATAQQTEITQFNSDFESWWFLGFIAVMGTAELVCIPNTGSVDCLLLHMQHYDDSKWRSLSPQPFLQPFSRTTRVSWCQKRTSGLYGAMED